MNPAGAAALLAVAISLAIVVAAVEAAAPAPKLVLERTLSLSSWKLEDFHKADKARLKNGVVGFSLGGMPGIYYTNVKLGTPPKEYSLHFDTGSDLMWVACSSCSSCPATNDLGIPIEFYRPNSSSTSSNVSCSDDRCKDAIKAGHSVCETSDSSNNQCGYYVAYADTTTSGYYVSDTLYLDTVLGKGNEQAASCSASVLFGCSNSLPSNLQTDGIVGFGKGAPSVVLQLNSQGVSPKAFSHCLKSSENGGGILVLGEIMDPGLVYTPLVQSQPLYNVNMTSIAVNGKKIHINSSLFTTSNTQGTIVDSRTALAYLADGVYEPVISAIDNAVPQFIGSFDSDGDFCYIVPSRRNISLFPILTLYFEGSAPMTVGPGNYLLRKGSSPIPAFRNIMCIGFQRSKDLEGYQHTTILGANIFDEGSTSLTLNELGTDSDLVLRDKLFVYDLEEMRLGWSNHNCSLLNNNNINVTVGSGSFRRHTPSCCSGLLGLLIAVISIYIIAPF